MDRKAMEEARLARLAKKRPPPTEDSKDEITQAPQAKQPRLNPSSPTHLPKPRPQFHPKPPSQTTSPPLAYPHGALKKTWCFSHPRKDDIKIEEILQRPDLQTALLSSWQLDLDWLLPKLDIPRTKLILIMHSKDASEQTQWREQCASNGWARFVRLCFPPMPKGSFTMHSKLMVLFFGEWVRVVVPSANLVGYDWGETGGMENSVFLIDLPRLPEELQGEGKNTTLTPFTDSLFHFLRAQGVDECMPDPGKGVTHGLLNFDFSNTKHLAFIHTIPGQHYGVTDALGTGYPLLSRAVRDLGLTTGDDAPLRVDYATSSLGALTEERLTDFCDALRGKEITVLTGAAPKASSKKPATSAPAKGKDKGKAQAPLSFANPAPTPSTSISKSDPIPSLKPQIRIHYPTAHTITTSNPGPTGAGTIFLPSSTWIAPSFPRHHFHDHVSTRPGVLSHSKLVYVRSEKVAYVVCGSANLSGAAWGTLGVVGRGERKGDLCLRSGNWECGVLVRVEGPEAETHATMASEPSKNEGDEVREIPDDASTDSEAQDTATNTHETFADAKTVTNAETDVLPMSTFEAHGIPVPFVCPGTPYVTTDSKTGKEVVAEPWVQRGFGGG